MNQYGTMARDHWARWLPQRYTQIEDPDSFFSTLGEEVAHQVGDLTLDLAGNEPAGEDYLGKVRRLNMARLQAEEIVLKERVLLPPESPEDQEKEPGAGMRSVPVVVDRSHPLWEQVNADQEERLQDS
ncbi:MAG TPA: hypothetical protein VGS19_18205 [Streptosporangiaceae bacterium]|nr:hypothetical protein [Streptosporangiaceae bacterium]